MVEKNKNLKEGTILMSIGALLLIASLLLTIFNLWDEKRAAGSADETLQRVQSEMEKVTWEAEVVPDYVVHPDMEMPTVTVDDCAYIGKLEIPVLGLSLPVMDSWSYPKLRIAPCRYTGSAYKDNLIIAAHNYSTHFGQLKSLIEGDNVIVIDVDKNEFLYEVVELETLDKTAVAEMEAGEWDLTLFTCTKGGNMRMVVRCQRISE